MSLLNWIFIILTVVKAYYIMWAFMHLEGETKSLRWSIVAPLVFLILYLCFIILVEGDYVFEVFKIHIINGYFNIQYIILILIFNRDFFYLCMNSKIAKF